MNLYGADFKEVISIINQVTRLSGENWRIVNRQLVGEGVIAGMSLRVRHSYTDKGLCLISLSGNGWHLSLQATKKRPTSMPEGEWNEAADIMHPPLRLIAQINASASSAIARPSGHRVCVHHGSIIGSEEFRSEMALLRLFVVEWL